MINSSAGANNAAANNITANNLPEKTSVGTFISTTTEQTIALGQILGNLLQAESCHFITLICIV